MTSFFKEFQDLENEKIPVVLVCCGSFSPITFLHLRMFGTNVILVFQLNFFVEMARDYLQKESADLRMIGGIISPVADAYKKEGLAPAQHRLAMAALACEDSDSLIVSDWEANQPQWTPTLKVLEKIRDELQAFKDLSDCKIMLLIGGDVFEAFQNSDVWNHQNLDTLLRRFGVIIVERDSVDVSKLISTTPVLNRNQENIYYARQFIRNEVSSSKIRQMLREGLSVRYLIPDKVIAYIQTHSLYQ